MLNRVILIGRLTRDPELAFLPGPSWHLSPLLLTAHFSTKTGNEADFIPIVVWRKQAENCANYLARAALWLWMEGCRCGAMNKTGSGGSYRSNRRQRPLSDRRATHVPALSIPVLSNTALMPAQMMIFHFRLEANRCAKREAECANAFAASA